MDLGAFSGEVKDGFLYGRGAVDMKGGIACSVAAVLQYLATMAASPKGSISFLITGDEEDISVNGTIKLLKWCAERGEKFDHCVLGEPAMSRCSATASRSAAAARNPARSMSTACRAMSPIRTARQSGAGYFAADRGALRRAARSRQRPVPGLQPRIHLGRCRQHRKQRDPGQARAKFNIRFNDNHTQETLRALVEERLAKPAATASAPASCGSIPTPTCSSQTRRLHRPRRQRDRGSHGRKPELSTSGGTSDARFISSYCPVIEFGLVGQTMHQVDERTPVSDLEKLTRIYRGVLDRYFSQA
jgi:succinyl-diaminopimelate desuccinylase